MISIRSVTVIVTCLVSFATHADEPVGLSVPGAKVTKLADGFLFTEGPASDAEGNVYFTDIPNGRIHVWSVDGKLSTFREDSGGANGLYFDASGNLIACEMERRRIASYAPDGSVTTVADRYDDKPLNMTNDLWIDPRGGIYFTDPYYGETPEALEQGGHHVYYVTPDGQSVLRVVDDLDQPNGVIGTLDGTQLYVSDPGKGKTFVYRILPDGALADRRLAAPVGQDGLTLDEHGNLYVAAEEVLVYAPDARRIASIKVPEQPANLTFGGPNGRTLFVTARTGLYSLDMRVRGQLAQPEP